MANYRGVMPTEPSRSERPAAARSDPAPWPRVRGLLLDGVGLLAVGLAVPIAILAIGLPIVFALRLVAAILSRF
jgi:hypothetical protein